MSKWSDDVFLDGLRAQGDRLADGCAAELHAGGNLSQLFRLIRSNATEPGTDSPEPLRAFWEATRDLPHDPGERRLHHGAELFLTHTFPIALVLLMKSLPEGYAAPGLSRILAISGDLETHPYRRLLGVVQMLVDVCARHAFEPQGRAIVTARKLRLLHAGVRRIAAQTPELADYPERYGVPVNHEDMLGTIMGFSLLVVEGLRTLELPLTDEDAEDFYYVWRVFAQAMGIHPPDEPASHEYVPGDLGEAAEFYASYARRHYVAAADNPIGVELARANERMLQGMMPRALRLLGMGVVPRIYTVDLTGPAAAERVGLPAVTGHAILRHVVLKLPALWQRPWDRTGARGHHHDRWARLFFQLLIDRAYGGEVMFLVPRDLADLRQLA